MNSTDMKWIVTAILIIFVVGINLWLVSALPGLRKRAQKPPTPSIAKMGDFLRNPWFQEDQRLNELSQKVKDLSKTPPSDPA